MAGKNPYIEEVSVQLPETRYKITFVSEGRVVEVDPSQIPFQRTGLPGSILDIALGNGIEIDHACGGVVACSTCHIHVLQGLESCNEPTEDEQDMLDMAPDLSPKSRLSCQCVPDGTQDVVVEVPAWNRNLVRESH
ncbi:MAG: 2Fe-2S iron-sulfur cluster binding domain-containing protein [Acidobacteria bacterium]|nr:2Fe-2S iron-sulfur cluster binding domain-containing protein [Acidobacteriota bacterium]